MSAASSRVFPLPRQPRTTEIEPRPLRASRNARVKSSSSDSRPTSTPLARFASYADGPLGLSPARQRARSAKSARASGYRSCGSERRRPPSQTSKPGSTPMICRSDSLSTVSSRPVRLSRQTRPSEKRSLLASTRGGERTCSGAAYAGVPAASLLASNRPSIGVAKPKSTSRGSPSRPSTMFRGLTSRCTSPAS